ncbi:hypothetical protein M409DRAFT_37371 [Zasmidium cellare ATCC 36951]|uniref:NACHT domain-containing protein n=1 Tax=Zasmidium cellare ATCC 36951 TaxID=1080233 RepID=A0A6A6C6M3_ZASCE|nr:uncharacterized protein M409DRAFT_37371 [Zasmidium cellare ATCC 36951]KAF2162675.1 hypothetical protein M409DRAFT_37371 [Zasmidium cellare ATCC 36951]
MPAIYGEGKARANRRLLAAISSENKADLGALPFAAEASYDSFAERSFAQCLEGTRIHLLNEIYQWADNANGRRIFWLCGKAGTGKSTISRTIARRFDKEQGCLGATFFFKRGEADRGSARRFFPTLAKQLVQRVPRMDYAIADALKNDICTKNLNEQFEHLLLRPLAGLHGIDHLRKTLILIIDAMDECEHSSDISLILTLLARAAAITSIRLCVFVTSRPELPVQLGFWKIDRDLHQDVVLEEAQETTIAHDIRAYLQHRFDEIKEEDWLSTTCDPLPADWPGTSSIQALVDLAVPLFVFAVTMCRFIAEADPQARLAALLRQESLSSFSGLEKTYLPILEQMIRGKDSEEEAQALAGFRDIVGSIVLLAEPLSIHSLSRLLQIPPRNIGQRLKQLNSVLSIPSNPFTPIRLFHLSFSDFLVDIREGKTNKFRVDKVHNHRKLAAKCLRMLSEQGALHQDLCNARSPRTRRTEFGKQEVAHIITADVAYACCYWVWHSVEGREMLCNDSQVHVFLKVHFLHWLEALSWLGRLSWVIAYMRELQTHVDVDQGDRLFAFLDDAIRFVLRNRHIIDLAPLQTYCSALVFAPKQSVVRRQFQQYIPRWLSLLPRVPSVWSLETQRLEGHSEGVTAIAFSSNLNTIVSASNDKTVRLWDTLTGEETQKLEGHKSYVNTVAVSANGQIVASGSHDKTVRLWDTLTGKETQRLAGHDSWVTAVALSPDNQIIASGSYDGTVRLWNTRTGEQTQRLGHDDCVTAVAFCPEGKVVASGSFDKTVRLWNTLTGLERQKFEGHNGDINAVAFSPCGQLVASGSDDETIRLWNTLTGKMQNLEGHESKVKTVVFSPDGTMIASGSNDKTVRLWNIVTGETQTLEGHDSTVTAVTFSSGGHMVVSGSHDKTIRLWNARKGKETQELKVTQRLGGHDDSVTAIALSPDGLIAVSGSVDKTVRVWNTRTGKELQKLEGHSNSITSVTFSRDGQTVASGSGDGTVRLWSDFTSTSQNIQKLEGHDDIVTAVAFSPDGQMVASGSFDHTVRVWNARTGQEIRQFQHDGRVDQLAFDEHAACLRTNMCTFDTPPYIAYPRTIRTLPTSCVAFQDPWIQCKAEEVLWLPHEYRGVNSAVYGNLLVIGQASGTVSFFRIDGNVSRVSMSESAAKTELNGDCSQDRG